MEKPKNLYVQPLAYELSGRNAGGKWGAAWREVQGRKKWDKCNRIINKIC